MKHLIKQYIFLAQEVRLLRDALSMFIEEHKANPTMLADIQGAKALRTQFKNDAQKMSD